MAERQTEVSYVCFATSMDPFKSGLYFARVFMHKLQVHMSMWYHNFSEEQFRHKYFRLLKLHALWELNVSISFFLPTVSFFSSQEHVFFNKEGLIWKKTYQFLFATPLQQERNFLKEFLSLLPTYFCYAIFFTWWNLTDNSIPSFGNFFFMIFFIIFSSM